MCDNGGTCSRGFCYCADSFFGQTCQFSVQQDLDSKCSSGCCLPSTSSSLNVQYGCKPASSIRSCSFIIIIIIIIVVVVVVVVVMIVIIIIIIINICIIIILLLLSFLLLLLLLLLCL